MSRPLLALVRALLVSFVSCALVLGARGETPVSCASPGSAQPQPTEYFVSLADSASHLAHVHIRLREGNGVRTLDMPVWNAVYQVRNFAANIENVRAQDASGAPVKVMKTQTSEWQMAAPAGRRRKLRYLLRYSRSVWKHAG